MSLSELLDPDLFATGDVHAVFARLRREAPIAFQPTADGEGFYAVTRHADVVTVLRDPHTFVSRRGTGFLTKEEPAFRSLNLSDGDDHRAMRAMIPRTAITALAPSIGTRARTLVDRFVSGGGGDVMSLVATPLTLETIGTLVGVERARWPELLDLSHRFARPDDPDHREHDGPEATWARAERGLMTLIAELIAARRASPRDDLCTKLIAEPLVERDLAFLVRLLLATGHETTAQAIGGGVALMAEHAVSIEAVRGAVEETLRLVSPLVRFGRFVAKDTVLSGVRLPAGSRVVTFFPAANRDPEVFADPDRFDPSRRPNEHLAFGSGPHACLGAPLARMQLEAVMRAFVGVPLRVRAMTRVRSSLSNGPKRAVVEVGHAR